MADTISRGAIMHLHWDMAQEMIDKISIINRGQHTQKEDTGVGTYAIEAISNYRIGFISVANNVVKPRMDIGILTMQFVGITTEKMNAVGA